MNGMGLLSGAIETAIGMILIALAGKMKGAQLRWFRFVLAGLLVTSFIVQQIVVRWFSPDHSSLYDNYVVSDCRIYFF